MRVALAAKAVYPFHHFGGVQKYVYALAKFLQNEGAQVEVISSLTEDKKIREAKYEGIQYRFLPPFFGDKIEKPIGWFWMHQWSFELSRYLKKTSYDVIHGFEMAPYYYLLRGKKAPVVYQLFLDTHRIRSTTKVKVPHFFSPGVALKYPAIYGLKLLPVKYCLERSDIVATEGEFQDQELVECFSVKSPKLFDIRIGVDLKSIQLRLQKPAGLTRKSFGIACDDFVAITVNRLLYEKGLSTLVGAIPFIVKKLPNFKVLMVGKGELETELIKQAKDFGVQKNLIHIREASEDELYDLYRMSNIYVSPTLQDDYIMGIQEAMACGLPIVSTGQRWLCHDGKNGFIVPKQNSEKMAEAVLKIAQDTNMQSEFAAQSKKLIEPFDWKCIATETIKQYERLLRNQI